jgi:hypothetical protein
MGITIGRKIEKYFSVKKGLAPCTDIFALLFPGFPADRTRAEDRRNAFGSSGSKVQ